MKKLRNILASFLCATMLIGCQQGIMGMGGKGIPTEGQYIPPEFRKQIIIESEEPSPMQQEDGAVVNPIKIALLVPLSGRYKETGQGLLNAAQLAIFRIGDANLTLMPFDTKDSPYDAVEASKKAIAGGAKIILGPVFSKSAKAIARIAAENNIQVVSFSNDKSLAWSGVFAIGFMPEQQIRRIVDFTIAEGTTDFTALLPRDNYGTIITSELKQIEADNEGRVKIENVIYQLDARGGALKLDKAVKRVSNSAMKGVAEKPNAILIPAGDVITKQALKMLKNYNFDSSKIQLLGNDQWDNPSLIENPLLDGAMFTALPRKRRSDFEADFKEAYGYNAPKLGGLAYDGIALAATIARISGGNDFSRGRLTNSRGFVGVDGIFRLQENGLAERGFAVMSISGGKAVVIDAAPTSFTDLEQ